MATNKSGKRTAGSNVARNYSALYKNAAAGASAAPVQLTKDAKEGEKVLAVLRTSDDVDWRGEYGYVLTDLRTLGIVTGVLVIAIVVVGLFV